MVGKRVQLNFQHLFEDTSPSLLESLSDLHCNVQLAANSVDCHQKQFIICTLEVTPHLCPFYSHVGALLPTQLLHALLRV